MGVSLSAAGGILLIGFVAQSSVFSAALHNSYKTYQNALDYEEVRIFELRQGDVDVTDVLFEKLFVVVCPCRTTITANNSGAVTYNLGKVDVLIDGVFRNGDVTSRKVDGVTSNVWGPGTTAVIVAEYSIDPPDAPTAIVLGMDKGGPVFWRA